MPSAGSESAKRYIRQKYKELGHVSFHEAAVLVLFVSCVMLWFFRDPGFMTGWANLILDVEVGDATAVMLVILVMFCLPAEPNFWCLGSYKSMRVICHTFTIVFHEIFYFQVTSQKNLVKLFSIGITSKLRYHGALFFSSVTEQN